MYTLGLKKSSIIPANDTMEPPIKPDESDCCNSGCNPCILDVYEEQLRKYNQKSNYCDSNSPPKRNYINPTSYTVFRLFRKTQHTKDTYLFSFEYIKAQRGSSNEDKDCVLQYNPGQYFILKCNDFTRAYTPIPFEEGPESNRFTALIKLYDGGKMSNYLKILKTGDETLWRGPYGDFVVNYNYYKHLCLIAQGTGLAPLFAIISNLLQNDQCESFIKLFFCCRSVHDILMREQLYHFASHWNFSYEVFLSDGADIQAKYNEIVHLKKLGLGDIQQHIHDKIHNLQVLICGSDQFMNNVRQLCKECNVDNKDLYMF